MPIMQTVIQGGGTTPTGTRQITNNGTYDVTDYANAEVNVPSTAPECYIKRNIVGLSPTVGVLPSDEPININNVTFLRTYIFAYSLVSANITGNAFINTESLTSLNGSSGEYCLYNCCKNANISGNLGLNYLESIEGNHFCDEMCSGSTITSTGLTSLKIIKGTETCRNMFSQCTSLTSTDLNNLITIGDDTLLPTAEKRIVESMFYRCTSLTSTGLTNLKNIYNALSFRNTFNQCTALTNIELGNLELVQGKQALTCMFRGCTALTTASFPKLHTIVGEACFDWVFWECSHLTTASFNKLKNINSPKAFSLSFESCPALTDLYFSSLTPTSFYGNTNVFYQMLKSDTNVTVHFPPQIQSTISSWADVIAGFSGTNTTIVFDQGVQVTVSIPTGYTVYSNGEDITNSATCYMYNGDNEIVSVSSDGKVGKYNFVATSSTTAFVFDPTQIVYNEITCASNVTGVAYSAKVSSDFVTVTTTADANDKIYCSAGFNLIVSGTATGYYADSVTTTSDTSNTVTLTFSAVLGVDTIDTTNFLSSITGDTTYASVDSVNNQLLYHYPTSATWSGSVQIALNVPAGTTKIKIATRACVSSEANFDFGYLALGTARANPQPTYSQVKAGTIANGVYLFRQSGTTNTMTDVIYETTDATQNVLTVGFAQDSSLQGTNTLYVEPITVIYT